MNNHKRQQVLSFCKIYHSAFTEEAATIRFDSSTNNYIHTALMLRKFELFSGIILLAQNDLSSNGYPLLRTLLETGVMLANSIKDKEFSKKYIHKAVEQKSKRLNQIAALKKPLNNHMSSQEMDELKSRFQEEMKNLNVSENMARIRDLFEKADLIEAYAMLYTYCSSYVHAEATSLDSYIEGPMPTPQLVTNKDETRDAVLTCLTAASFFAHFYSLYCKSMAFKSNALINFAREYERINQE